MTLRRRQFLTLASASLAGLIVPCGAFAQAYPSRAVKVIVPNGPGGQGDTTARLVTLKLSENLGQSFFVENIGSGGGNIAIGTAARAAPDGYTILAATTSFVTNPSLYAKIPYDPHKDFAPVSLMCSSPHILVVHPSVPAQNVKELIALAKADPGKYSYGTAGRGTPAHLVGELFKLAFGVDITHVPFSGGGPATASAVGGHVPVAVSALPTAIAYVKAGNLRALGLMGSTRSSALPDMPTMKELTGQDIAADIVNGFMVPTGTPQPIVDLLHREVVKVIAAPDIKARLADLGFDPVGSTPEVFGRWVETELVKWAKVIRDAKIDRQ